jgi:hypothetical protein
MTKGWGWPRLSRTAHYFVDARSLCGRWLFRGDLDDTRAETAGPDDCASCRKKYDKTYASGTLAERE